MTAARAEQPGTIPGRTWNGIPSGKCPTSLYIGASTPGDDLAEIGVTIQLLGGTDMPNLTWLGSAQLREIAADLLERAEAMENVPGRNRRTPAWHIRQGERLVSQVHKDTTAADADVLALLAGAHFQAAQALRRHTTVHIHHDPEGDTT